MKSMWKFESSSFSKSAGNTYSAVIVLASMERASIRAVITGSSSSLSRPCYFGAGSPLSSRALASSGVSTTIFLATYFLFGAAFAISAIFASSTTGSIPIVEAMRLAQLSTNDTCRGSLASKAIGEGHLFGPDQNGYP